jgi:hypothetical protein
MARQARVQTGLRLDGEVIDRLRHSERGLSDEIRDRLERTFKEDAIDAVTRELRDGLTNIAANLALDFGAQWHASPRAHEAFAAAIAQRVAAYAPPPRDGVGASDLFGPADPPETIGRLRERDDQRTHGYEHLGSAQKSKTARLLRHIRPNKDGNDE